MISVLYCLVLSAFEGEFADLGCQNAVGLQEISD